MRTKSVGPMTSVADALGRLSDEQRRPLIVTEIARIWDELAELVETEAISEAQFGFLVRSEPPEEAPTLLLRVWLTTLRRAVEHPRNIGVDWDALRPSATCRCEGSGLVYDTTTSHPGWRPCERCQTRAYRWWADHDRDPGHSCDDCSGPRRRRRNSPTGEREDRAEDQAAERLDLDGRDMDDLR